jgi:hypothetical protein
VMASKLEILIFVYLWILTCLSSVLLIALSLLSCSDPSHYHQQCYQAYPHQEFLEVLPLSSLLFRESIFVFLEVLVARIVQIHPPDHWNLSSKVLGEQWDVDSILALVDVIPVYALLGS